MHATVFTDLNSVVLAHECETYYHGKEDEGGRNLNMLIENFELKGVKSELSLLDEVTEKAGFIRWQWEYYRATYDFQIKYDDENYYLRLDTRVEEGKLEKPDAILRLDGAYIGRATFPHGLDYETPIPQPVLKTAEQKLAELKQALN